MFSWGFFVTQQDAVLRSITPHCSYYYLQIALIVGAFICKHLPMHTAALLALHFLTDLPLWVFVGFGVFAFSLSCGLTPVPALAPLGGLPGIHTRTRGTATSVPTRGQARIQHEQPDPIHLPGGYVNAAGRLPGRGCLPVAQAEPPLFD
jgi:hypothetical protein